MEKVEQIDLASTFLTIAELLRASSDMRDCWRKILASARVEDRGLTDAKIEEDVARVGAQLSQILTQDPPPSDLAFVYFGLFEKGSHQHRARRAGLYVAGGVGNPERSLDEGRLSYSPHNRFLESSLLLAVARATRAQSSNQRQVFDYLLTFGAAGLIAKFSSLSYGIPLPVFVGFDSGDYARVAN